MQDQLVRDDVTKVSKLVDESPKLPETSQIFCLYIENLLLKGIAR